MSLKAYEALAPDLRAIVAEACFAEHAAALAEAERLNAEALTALTGRYNVKVMTFPDTVLKGAREAATETLAEVARSSPLAGRIAESYAAAKERGKAWGALQSGMNAALARI